jgi:predicted RNase H-like HicB family nuclease
LWSSFGRLLKEEKHFNYNLKLLLYIIKLKLIMQYQVFVKSHTENKFIASIIGIPDSTVEGATKEEAIALAKAALEKQLASGEIVTIDVGKESSQQEKDPWLKHMGIFASDPTFDDFLSEVAAYRQQVSEDEVFE